jgi:hypothetical protein
VSGSYESRVKTERWNKEETKRWPSYCAFKKQKVNWSLQIKHGTFFSRRAKLEWNSASRAHF